MVLGFFCYDACLGVLILSGWVGFFGLLHFFREKELSVLPKESFICTFIFSNIVLPGKAAQMYDFG